MTAHCLEIAGREATRRSAARMRRRRGLKHHAGREPSHSQGNSALSSEYNIGPPRGGALAEVRGNRHSHKCTASLSRPGSPWSTPQFGTPRIRPDAASARWVSSSDRRQNALRHVHGGRMVVQVAHDNCQGLCPPRARRTAPRRHHSMPGLCARLRVVQGAMIASRSAWRRGGFESRGHG